MTRDDVIRTARETGLERIVYTLPNGASDWVVPDYERLERFAALVAAAEREACAKLCDELQDVPATEPHHCAEDIRARSES